MRTQNSDSRQQQWMQSRQWGWRFADSDCGVVSASSSSSSSVTAALTEQWLPWPSTIWPAYPHSSKRGARPAAAPGSRRTLLCWGCFQLQAGAAACLKAKCDPHSPLRRPLATAPAATSGHPDRADGGYPFLQYLATMGGSCLPSALEVNCPVVLRDSQAELARCEQQQLWKGNMC